jgi:antitoxin PrlF
VFALRPEESRHGEACNADKYRQSPAPREIRDRLGLKAGDKVALTLLSEGTLILRAKTRRLSDLAAMLTRPDQPTVAVEDMNPFR